MADIPKCDQCSTDAVTFIRYSGAHLCGSHLTGFVLKRAQQNIRQQMDVDTAGSKPAVIVVAASGGKDSGTCLDVMVRTFSERRDVKVIALTIDEGTEYRKGCIGIVKRFAKRLGIPHEVRSFRDTFGLSLGEIVERTKERSKGPCTYCGVLRRNLVNRTARELGAFRVATGLNLDDTAQTVLMNFSRGDLVRMARMAPHTKVQPGLVPRMQPLISIPEKETFLYSQINSIPVMEGTCPHRGEAMRNRFRKVVLGLERESPGTRHALLGSFFEIKEMLLDRYPPADLSPCERCGEPTVGHLCEACKLMDEIRS